MYGSDSLLMPPVTLAEMPLNDNDPARFSRYKSYLDFYNGNQWMEKRKPGERRLTVNYARGFIHKGTSYLMGRPVRFELTPGVSGSEEEALRTQELLAGMWDDNSLALIDYDAAVDAAVLGDCAFKVTLQAADYSAVAKPLRVVGGKPGPQARNQRVVVRSVDVMGLTAGWRHDDMRRLTWVNECNRMTGQQITELYGPEGLPAGSKLENSYKVEERWTDREVNIKVSGKPVHSQPNPYGFIPYVIVPNLSRPRQFWGLSDLEDIVSLNSEFNVRVSILSQLLQMSGNPVLVLENVDSSEGLRVGPGAIWTLPEGSKASLLELLKDGGVGLHLDYINLLYRMMHDLTELPAAGFGRDQAAGSSSSGVALEQLLYPVVQRVARKRRIWDEALDLRNRMMLALAGLPVLRSRFTWADVLPKDRAGLVTQEVGLVASNVHSLETARRTLGDEQPELENARIKQEHLDLGLALEAGTSSGGIQPPVKLSGALVEGLSNSGG